MPAGPRFAAAAAAGLGAGLWLFGCLAGLAGRLPAAGEGAGGDPGAGPGTDLDGLARHDGGDAALSVHVCLAVAQTVMVSAAVPWT